MLRVPPRPYRSRLSEPLHRPPIVHGVNDALHGCLKDEVFSQFLLFSAKLISTTDKKWHYQTKIPLNQINKSDFQSPYTRFKRSMEWIRKRNRGSRYPAASGRFAFRDTSWGNSLGRIVRRRLPRRFPDACGQVPLCIVRIRTFCLTLSSIP